MKLDIGSGPGPYKDFTGLDHIQYNDRIVKADLNKPLAYESNSIDEIYISHTLEHLNDPIEIFFDWVISVSPGEHMKNDSHIYFHSLN